MLFKHLLQLLCIERARAIVIELEEHILDVILRLQLRLCLHVEIFGCVLMARHEPVLSCQTAHDVAHVAKEKDLH